MLNGKLEIGDKIRITRTDNEYSPPLYNTNEKGTVIEEFGPGRLYIKFDDGTECDVPVEHLTLDS